MSNAMRKNVRPLPQRVRLPTVPIDLSSQLNAASLSPNAKMRLPRLLLWPALVLVLGTLPIGQAGCTSSRSSVASGGAPQQGPARIPHTPDTLVTRLSPRFYRSPSPRSTLPIENSNPPFKVTVTGFNAAPSENAHSTNGGAPPTLTVEVIGGYAEPGRAQWALRLQTIASSAAALDTLATVDLLNEHVLMRRGHAWRTFDAAGDSLTSTRLVPLLPSDVRRLARSDTVLAHLNGHRFRLSNQFRSDLHALRQATPDSLHPDTSAPRVRLTVPHNLDTAPSVAGGIEVLQRNFRYPDTPRNKAFRSGSGLGFS